MNKLVLLCFLSLFVRANEITFDSIEQTGKKEITISFKLEKVSLIRSYSLENPSRIVIEVNQSELKNNIDVPYNYPIKKVRASQDGGLTRIVVDLYESVYWQNPSQIIDEENIYLKLAIKKDKNLNKNIRDIVVAIDAGHGGKYPGAVGPNNILEKDITLLIAKELQRTLDNTTGYRSVMIRAGDETIGLNDRYQNARKFGADIFISIHADGFRLSSVKGASVYIWSEKASSIAAENLSKKELASKIGKIAIDDFDEDKAREDFPNIYKLKIEGSKRLGNEILSELRKDPYTKLHKKNIEFADFRVLKSFDTPSVLIESGFMTNPDDAERLKGKPGRRMIARSIFLGLHNYFKNQPVADSVFEKDSKHVMYEIQKGDVLSEIAVRFGLSVETIEIENQLENKSIYPGQIIRLKI